VVFGIYRDPQLLSYGGSNCFPGIISPDYNLGMARPSGIIENPRRYEPRNRKSTGIFFAIFTMAALVRFVDALPRPWSLVLILLLGIVVLTLSYLLWRPSGHRETDSPSDSEAP
jgi:hypothetical protein